ncbi:DUF2795 domain-containing protein [Actinomadura chokoriensis]|uniref:DUF2795 domain-containing protein n=1 Tax=Actinomadura chokoriensis TaxID=454156 RepID=A0ABV4QW55_9ACTN
MADNPSFIGTQKCLGDELSGVPGRPAQHAQEHGADEPTLQTLQAMPGQEYDDPSAAGKEITKTS